MTMSSSVESSVRAPSRQQRRLQARMSRKSAARLGGYLAAGVAAGMVGTAQSDAAVVQVNVGPTGFNINQINGGATVGTSRGITNFPFTGAGTLMLANGISGGALGLGGYASLSLAKSGSTFGPTKLTSGQTIDSSLTFVTGYPNFYQTMFAYNGAFAPNFGSGSYIAFKTAQNNYGWLEVTWDQSSTQFQLVSGAYESAPNTPIVAGVPEPSTIAASGVAALALGAGAIRRARRSSSLQAAG